MSFSVAFFNPQGATLGADEATVKIADQRPTATGGSNQNVSVGDLVTLTALESTDPEGESLTYSWREVAGPAVSLMDGDRATTTFNAPNVTSATNLEFLLTVTDVAGNESTDFVVVTVSAPASGGGGGGGSSGGGGGGGGALAPFELILLIAGAGTLWRFRSRLKGQTE
jgi:hypothetical protein